MRAIANDRSPFVKIDGEVVYGSISAKEAAKSYGGEIVFQSEEDIFEPLLSVSQTLGVSYVSARWLQRTTYNGWADLEPPQSLKKPHTLPTPMKRSEFARDFTDRILNTFGMPHTVRRLPFPW